MNNALIAFKYYSLLMLVKKNTVVHCLFMLVHSPFTNVKNTTCDFNNALVDAEINITSTAFVNLIVNS